MGKNISLKSSFSLTAMLFAALLLTTMSSSVNAEDKVFSTKSPPHRVSLLELYTSEGCSSCPPADKFLSGIHESGINKNHLIPLSFHVTYWDYIGWKDPYANLKHDNRQRRIAKFDDARTIYTPQFVFNGSDYREYNMFSKNIHAVANQPSSVNISLEVKQSDTSSDVKLMADASNSNVDKLEFYIVLYENNLTSHVNDGENEGVTLHHDYVVRSFYGPFVKNKTDKLETLMQTIPISANWKKQDLGLVAYAQNPYTGKVMQAVELKLN